MEPGRTQEEQRAKEDREPTALVPEVQVSIRCSGFPIGRRRAETGKKAKAKAKEKADEEAMVVDPAKTDE